MEFNNQKYGLVTLHTKHTGYDEISGTNTFFREHMSEFFRTEEEMEKKEDEYQGSCDDVHNFKTLWKGRIDCDIDHTIGTKLKERLADDEHNETAAEVLCATLKIPGVVNAIIAAIPDDWEYREFQYGSDPTKRDLAFNYVWETMQEDNVKIVEEYSKPLTEQERQDLMDALTFCFEDVERVSEGLAPYRWRFTNDGPDVLRDFPIDMDLVLKHGMRVGRTPGTPAYEVRERRMKKDES